MSEHPQRRSGVEVTPSADGYLARVAGSESLTWLNRTGYLVLELCTGHNDAEVIARAIQQAFDLTSSPLPAVRSALSDLVAAGLVTPGAQSPLTDASLTIALWAPGPSVDAELVTEVQGFAAEADAAGIDTTVQLDQDRSMRGARNRAASAVLRGDSSTHVLFLDATREAFVAVRERPLTRLLASPHEVIGIPVPFGSLEWDRVREAVIALPDLTSTQVQALARRYDVSFTSLPEPRRSQGGFLEGRHCSSGALLVRRSGLERIAGSGVAAQLRGQVQRGMLSMEEGWGFFDSGRTSDGIDIDEDLAFCERVRSAGGAVMIDVTGSYGLCLDVGMRLRASSG